MPQCPIAGDDNVCTRICPKILGLYGTAICTIAWITWAMEHARVSMCELAYNLDFPSYPFPVPSHFLHLLQFSADYHVISTSGSATHLSAETLMNTAKYCPIWDVQNQKKFQLLGASPQGFIQPPRRYSLPWNKCTPPPCGRTINSPLRGGVPVLREDKVCIDASLYWWLNRLISLIVMSD